MHNLDKELVAGFLSELEKTAVHGAAGVNKAVNPPGAASEPDRTPINMFGGNFLTNMIGRSIPNEVKTNIMKDALNQKVPSQYRPHININDQGELNINQQGIAEIIFPQGKGFFKPNPNGGAPEFDVERYGMSKISPELRGAVKFENGQFGLNSGALPGMMFDKVMGHLKDNPWHAAGLAGLLAGGGMLAANAFGDEDAEPEKATRTGIPQAPKIVFNKF